MPIYFSIQSSAKSNSKNIPTKFIFFSKIVVNHEREKKKEKKSTAKPMKQSALTNHLLTYWLGIFQLWNNKLFQMKMRQIWTKKTQNEKRKEKKRRIHSKTILSQRWVSVLLLDWTYQMFFFFLPWFEPLSDVKRYPAVAVFSCHHNQRDSWRDWCPANMLLNVIVLNITNKTKPTDLSDVKHTITFHHYSLRIYAFKAIVIFIKLFANRKFWL